MIPEQTYTLNCALCGDSYESKEAFPESQVCPTCFGNIQIEPAPSKSSIKKSTKLPLSKARLTKDKKKKKQAKKSRKRNRKK